ncbi:MAG: fumarylacetoacetate hydrolase [Frankiales bacterium]|nr:fumarylacetoacetate hydrolase [Frankiales bacterium]
MHLAAIHGADGVERPALIHPRRGVLPAEHIRPVSSVIDLLTDYEEFSDALVALPDSLFLPRETVRFAPPYRSPRKIWGIGLNYVEHASDLSAELPTEPASFIKGDHTIIGPDDEIVLPAQSERVTAEAELGLVIGRTCRNVSESDALDYVWGVCAILDQTAEDILQRNPRFLTRSKNFPTFFSFGPELIPLAEFVAAGLPLDDLAVSTVRNGVAERTNSVSNMTFGLAYLVSFHSAVMPLFPGDIISTGTPGAVVIDSGDVVECRITGLAPLRNRVAARLSLPDPV